MPNTKLPAPGDWLLVVDYNLARIDDVRLMTTYAKNRYGLRTALIRPNPTEQDHALAEKVWDLDPLDPQFITKALNKLGEIRPRIRAVLPFSDNAVFAGPQLAEALGCLADSSEGAQAAFSKSVYREEEQKLRAMAEMQNLFVPRFEKVHSLTELRKFAESCPKGFVLKPSCEGNNRGVLRLNPGDDLESAFQEVMPYLAGGLIAEELIPFEEEFSFDGIGELCFITQKMSLSSKYPVEIGQKLPAPMNRDLRQTVARAGRFANLIVGQLHGPFHNEVKVDGMTMQASVVEPNRRPAGMKIWHLAERVYGLNFFHLWVDRIVTGDSATVLPEPKGMAAIRQLRPSKDGMVLGLESPESQRQLFNQIVSELEKGGLFPEVLWSDFRILKRDGDRVTKEAKDNGGFLGEVCLFSRNLDVNFEMAFAYFEATFQKLSEGFLTEVRDENLGIASNSLS